MNSILSTERAKEATTDEIQPLPTLMNRSPDNKCPLVGAVVGSIVGLVLGIVQLIYIGSWELVYWAFVPMIPLYSALGWALFGMTIGGSGLFDIEVRAPEKNKLRRPRQYDQVATNTFAKR